VSAEVVRVGLQTVEGVFVHAASADLQLFVAHFAEVVFKCLDGVGLHGNDFDHHDAGPCFPAAGNVLNLLLFVERLAGSLQHDAVVLDSDLGHVGVGALVG